MEAAPRLQMLCFEQKTSPKAADFSHPLKRFIAEFYNEEPSGYSRAIDTMEQLRISACKASKDEEGISVLRRYYSQLKVLQNRFPMTDDGAACVAFMWSDLYSGVVFNIADVKYELSSILYNLGALHSQLGAMEDRTTADGMKNSCTHFQYAAWAFQHNRDFYPQPKGCDLSHDLLTFYSLIMLAQSQECILEKSLLDNRKSAISAKIAAQIVDFYGKAMNNLSGDVKAIVGSKIFQPWKRICEMKTAYYGALTALHMGMTAEDEKQYGLRVAWYNLAWKRFGESLGAAEDIGIAETLAFTSDVIEAKLQSAIKENDFIYHDKVPDIENLQAVKGAVLVKGLPFDCLDPEVSGPDLFATLIPLGAHEASSIYSEKKAKILRKVSKTVEDKNAELAEYESSLNVDKKTLEQLLVKPTLPDDIIQICATFSTKKNAIEELNENLLRLRSLADKIGELIKEAERYFAMSKPGSVTTNVVNELRAEFSKYNGIYHQSTESDEKLAAALKIHEKNLDLLRYSPQVLPQKLPHLIEATAEDKVVISKLTKLLDKLDEMKKQREDLFQGLRKSMLSDDLTRIIVATVDEKIEDVFENGLAKHKQQVAILDKNIQAQEKILEALTEANAQAAEVRMHLENARRPYQKSIDGMRASFKAFEDIETQTKRGMEFYEKFNENVSKLVTRLKNVIQVEKEQEARLQMAETANIPIQPPTRTPEAYPNWQKPQNSNPIPPQAPAGQPPKLRDYLNMMSRANTNTSFLPSASPGSPSISVPSNYSMVATSPMSSTNNAMPNANFPGGYSGRQDRSQYPDQMPSIPRSTVVSRASQSNTNAYTSSPTPSMNGTAQPVSNSTPTKPAQYSHPTTLQTNPYPVYGHLYSNTPQKPPSQVQTHYQSPGGYQQQAARPMAQAQNGQPQYKGPVNQNGSEPLADNRMMYSGTYQLPQQVPQQVPPQAPQIQPQQQPNGSGQTNQSPLPQQTAMPQGFSPAYRMGYGDHQQQPMSSYTPNAMMMGSSGCYSSPPINSASAYVMSGQYGTASSPYNQNYLSSGNPYMGNTNATVQPMSNYTATNAGQSQGTPQNLQFPNVGMQNYPAQAQGIPAQPIQAQSPAAQSYVTQPQPVQSPAVVTVVPQKPPIQNLIDESCSNLAVGSTEQILQPTRVTPVIDAKEGATDSKPIVEEVAITPQASNGGVPKSMENGTGTKSFDAQAESRTSRESQDLPDSERLEPVIRGTLSELRDSFEKLEAFMRTFDADQKWREYLDIQDLEARSLKISVGRICSMKNRFPDVMPYDHNRVVLTTSKDDYVNASYLKPVVAGEPSYILTQAPLQSTLEDFWAMLWENEVETLVSISTPQEFSASNFFPVEKGASQKYGQYNATVVAVEEKFKGLFSEILLKITNPLGSQKNLIVVQHTGNLRDAPKTVQLAEKVFYYIRSQKRKANPIVIQCLSGCGRSGVLAFTLRWLSHLELLKVPHIPEILASLVRGRKLVLMEKEQLKSCYDVAYHSTRQRVIDENLIESPFVRENEGKFPDEPQRELPPSRDSVSVEQKLLNDLMEGFQIKPKITKESFEKPKGLNAASGSSDDPLGQLDPLWSLRK